MDKQRNDIQSGDDLASRVRTAMCRQGYIRLSGIKCESEGSTVFLNGVLSTSYLKQVAKSIAARVPGVERVVDRTKVIE